MHNALIQIGHCHFDPIHEKLIHQDTPVRLTTQEANILMLLCQYAGTTLNRYVISRTLKGYEHHPLSRSIDMTINRLRQKLREKPAAPQCLYTVWGKGYRLVLKPD